MAELIRAAVVVRRDEGGIAGFLGLLEQSNVGLARVETVEAAASRLATCDRHLVVLLAEDPVRERTALVQRLQSDPTTRGVPALLVNESHDLSRVLDAIRDGVVHLDGSGRVVWCNEAMAELLNLERDRIVGRPFSEVARGLAPRDANGRQPGVARQATVRWHRGDRQYRVTAGPIAEPSGGVVMTVQDVTVQSRLEHRVEESTAQIHAAEARIEHLEREARLIQDLGPEPNVPTAVMGSLRQGAPQVFADLCGFYSILLDRRTEAAAFGGQEHEATMSLTTIADRLGRMGAGPRDIVELHGEALRALIQEGPRSRGQALTNEGRFLVLELMGHLASFYRLHGGPARPASHGVHASPPDEDSR